MNNAVKVLIAIGAIGAAVSLVILFSGSRPVGSENLVGKALPQFAAPLGLSGINQDSNVYTRSDAKADKTTAACDVKIKGAFNSCRDLTGSAIVAFWNASKPSCINQVTTLDQLVAKDKRIHAVAVAFENDATSANYVVRQQRWKVPVAIDRDGAVSSLYDVTGCPSLFFAKNGRITAVKLGLLSAAQMRLELKQ